MAESTGNTRSRKRPLRRRQLTSEETLKNPSSRAALVFLLVASHHGAEGFHQQQANYFPHAPAQPQPPFACWEFHSTTRASSSPSFSSTFTAARTATTERKAAAVDVLEDEVRATDHDNARSASGAFHNYKRRRRRRRRRPSALPWAVSAKKKLEREGEDDHDDNDPGSIDGRPVCGGSLVGSDDDGLLQRALPPWLDRYRSASEDQVDGEVGWLEYAMLERGFAVADVREVVLAIRDLYWSGGGDAKLAVGAVDFCRLLLTLRDEEPYVDGFVTKEVLIAAIIHYGDCIDARRENVLEVVRTFVFGAGSTAAKGTSLALPPAAAAAATTAAASLSESDTENFATAQQQPPGEEFAEPSFAPVFPDEQEHHERDGHLNVEAQLIADGAAKIKRAEMIAQSIKTDADVPAVAAWTSAEASRMRGLLLSVMDDWRSLAIRCVASLYRLEGIMQQLDSRGGAAACLDRTPEMVQTAREAMRIYATLAQRMGMHRLKAMIEERAFKILYKRQYKVVSSLYEGKGDAMEKLSGYLLSQISEALHDDDALMYQIEDLQLSSRVKEPFSFWKKLLKKRMDYLLDEGSSSQREEEQATVRSSSDSINLTVADVQDGIALRIILKARKLTPEETNETTRLRERLLCYYVQRLVRSKWPEIDDSRLKDYIRNPKPNGYQSLHHTSVIHSNGMEFPFEIQIRTEEMHRVAEFGVAAHWDYKLGSANPLSLEASSSDEAETDVVDATTGLVLPLSPQDENPPIDQALPGSSGSSSRSYLDALVHAKQGLMTHVFLAGSTPARSDQGTIVTLPPGSRVEDAVLLLHPRCRNAENGQDEDPIVWRNGKLARLNDEVENGDVLMITP